MYRHTENTNQASITEQLEPSRGANSTAPSMIFYIYDRED